MAVLRPKSSLKAGLQTRISRVFTVCSSRFSVLFGQNENCWASSGLYRNFAPPEQLAEQSPAGMRIIDWGRMAPRSFTQSNPRLGRGARCARFHCVCFFMGHRQAPASCMHCQGNGAGAPFYARCSPMTALTAFIRFAFRHCITALPRRIGGHTQSDQESIPCDARMSDRSGSYRPYIHTYPEHRRDDIHH